MAQLANTNKTTPLQEIEKIKDHQVRKAMLRLYEKDRDLLAVIQVINEVPKEDAFEDTQTVREEAVPAA